MITAPPCRASAARERNDTLSFLSFTRQHGDGLDDAVDGVLAKGVDAGCHDRHSAGQVLSQLVIERANTYCSRVHLDSPLCLDENRRHGSSCTPEVGM
jgi:hypothetical protein